MIERGKQPLNKTEDKILLLFLPIWPPQIPPLGIACLKGYLQPHGYTVKIGDANTAESLSGTDGKYFEILTEIVPPEKRGNFYNVGREVLHNHLMALTRRKDEQTYRELVKQLIAKTFYIEAAEEEIQRLHTELETFFNNLEHYIQQRLEEEKPALLGLSVNRGNLAASLFVFQ
ncbi:MAG: hypothetical protein GY757_46975, partial [bacterium]|nr:hypothetical protein [bacterium]